MRFSIFATAALANFGLSLAAPLDSAEGPTLTKKAIASLTGDNGIETPLPTQAGMVDNCEKFYFVQPNEICADIAPRNGISVGNMIEWNTEIGNECRNLWAGTNACVRTIGFVPPVQKSCYAGAAMESFGDKAAVRAAKTAWCSSAGTGIFNLDQIKTGCVNAPNGKSKFNLRIDNLWKKRMALRLTRCEELLSIPIDSCDKGGQAVTESWIVEITQTAGKC
jgi:hypothetical protein